MRRWAMLAVFLGALGAGSAFASTDTDLAREILRRIPEWPQAQVEIPIGVYEEYLRGLMGEPRAPQPPVSSWIERAAYRVTLAEKDAQLQATLDVIVLPGARPQALGVLSDGVAWKSVTLDGKPFELIHMPDGWFFFAPPGPGRYRLVAQAPLKPTPCPDGTMAGLRTAPAAWATAEVDSAAAWDVTFKGSDERIGGSPAGTRGTVGLRPGEDLAVTWRKPLPPAAREARIEFDAQVGWTLGDGVHQVRAILNAVVWGGEVKELSLNLPDGADRVSVTGPDVREVQVQGASAHVFLRGSVTGKTRLAVAFDVPRKASGPMSLGSFGIAGASPRGGVLAIGGGSGAVLLEGDSPGLVPMALRDLPDDVRGLLAAAPVYAYTLGAGAWTARIDAVDMAEFPVRETLIDSALYTVLLRPDGHVMTKVIYEVRNRAQQYMKVDLPEGATLLVARVSEQQRNLARGPGSSVYVPLEKSVLTTAGLISFPVEIVYLVPAPPLARSGKLSLPLPRADLPIAYARGALMLPDGMKVREWQGTLRQVPAWSSETANLEFEYGSGHLAKGADGADVHRLGRGNEDFYGWMGGAQFAPKAQELPEPAEDAQAKVLQSKNFYRAGVQFYNRGDYRKAGDLFKQVTEAAPDSTEAENAKKYMANVDIALGKGGKDSSDRTLKATAKAVQRAQQWSNTAIVEKQEQALQQAEQAAQSGQTEKAETAYQVAVDIAGKLQERGEEAREQTAAVRKGKEFLEKAAKKREADDKEVGALQRKLKGLKQDVGRRVQSGGGKAVDEAIDALVDLQEAATDMEVNGDLGISSPRTGPGTGGGKSSGGAAKKLAQIDVKSNALAEQSLNLSNKSQLSIKVDSRTNSLLLRAEKREDVETLKKIVEKLESVEKGLDDSRSMERAPKVNLNTAGDSTLSTLPKLEDSLKKLDTAKEELQEDRTAAHSGDRMLEQAEKKVEPDRIVHDQKALEKLEEPLKQLEGVQMELKQEGEKGLQPQPIPSKPTAPARKPTAAIAREELAQAYPQQPAKDQMFTLGDVPVLGRLQQKAAEKSRSLVAEETARAEELMKEGKITEAEELLQGVSEKLVDASRATAIKGGTARIAQEPPVAHEELKKLDDLAIKVQVKTAEAEMESKLAEEKKAPATEGEADPRYAKMRQPIRKDADVKDRQNKIEQLWGEAEKHRKAMQFEDAITDLDKLVQIDPASDRARLWRDDLVYLDAQAKQAKDRNGRERGAGEAQADANAPAHLSGDVAHGTTENLKYPVHDLVAMVPDFGGQAPPAGTAKAPPAGPGGNLFGNAPAEARPEAAAWRRLNEAQLALAANKKRLSSINFDVNDITADTDDGKKLAEFVGRNYSWAFQQGKNVPQMAQRQLEQAQEGPDEAPQAAAEPAPAVLANSYGANTFTNGKLNINTASEGLLRQLEGRYDNGTVRYTDGSLSVANDPNATENVKALLERLRVNRGQRVAVGSRNLFVDAGRAAAAGVKFAEGANGVRYAIVNEGQLMSLMDIEQRAEQNAEAVPDVPREARQEAIVGTGALLANGGTLTISGAADEANTLSYNGNDLAVPHDDYVVLDNGSYLTAVKSGRMQHWAAEVEPVRFPGVPAAVVVPVVGHTLKFEKTLLHPKDSLELVTEYTWQGEER